MLDVLLKSKSEIIGIISLLATCWLGLLALSLQKRALPRKAFGLGGVSRIVFSSPVERAEEFEVRFRGDVITRLTENHAFFMNTGNVEITKEDFHRPVEMVIETTERIYDCEVIAKRPADLGAKVTATTIDGQARITLAPLLMNPGDFVAVRFMRAGRPRPDRSTAGRIRGVPTIDYLLPGEYSRMFTTYPLTLVATALMFFALSGLILSGTIPSPSPAAYYIGLIPLLIGLGLLGAALDHRVRWRAMRQASYMGKGTEFLEFQPLVKED
jgi:hypothetical protein